MKTNSNVKQQYNQNKFVIQKQIQMLTTAKVFGISDFSPEKKAPVISNCTQISKDTQVCKILIHFLN